MTRYHDKVPTYAFCASLLIHAMAAAWIIHTYVEDLSALLTWKPIQQPEWVIRRVTPSEPPKTVLLPYTPPLKLDAPPPLADLKQADLVPPKRKPLDNSEWGEKDGQGIAITSAPGKSPMSARQGEEDQSFASRDPEGPGAFPEDPSMSTVPQGEGGDGRKPANDPLAGKGTDGAPALVLGPTDRQIPEPPPDLTRTTNDANTGNQIAQLSGTASSRLPAGDKPAPTSDPIPALADNAGQRTPIASAQNPAELLPIKSINPIAPPSLDPPYPDIVNALTRPPTTDRLALGQPQELPDIVAAETEATPDIQPAILAMIEDPITRESVALNAGLGGPIDSPDIVAALLHPPGGVNAEGNQASLPDLAAPDAPGADEIQDAIAALLSESRLPEPLARQLDASSSTAIMVATPKGNIGSIANAVGGRPGAPTPAADPAADTGLESDPFSKIPGVQFRNGKVDARNGRVVKPIRPRLTEAGRRDLLSLQFPTVLMKVKIDNTGKVIDVTVIRGSGSEAIDMPVYRALWGWYFEPPKDKDGNPLPDTQLVAIHWG